MTYSQLASRITDEIAACLEKTDPAQIEGAVALLDGAERIFLAGAGRSGLEVSSFAMRLTHIGLRAYRVGEVTTPAIRQGDVLVVCSGSGETGSMRLLASIARGAGARVLLLTTRERSALAELCDEKIVLHAKAAKAADTAAASVQPMSNLFVQALCITLDILIIRLMERRSVDETTMRAFHANLE